RKVHDFFFLAERAAADLRAMAGQDLLDRESMGLAILIEQALKRTAQFDALVLRGPAGGAKEAVADLAELRMSAGEIFENVGHVPCRAQSHLHFTRHMLQLAGEQF